MEWLTFLFVKSDERQMNCLPLMKLCGTLGIMFHFTKLKNRRLVRACDYCGDVQVRNTEIEHLWNILLEGAPYMKKYEN